MKPLEMLPRGYAELATDLTAAPKGASTVDGTPTPPPPGPESAGSPPRRELTDPTPGELDCTQAMPLVAAPLAAEIRVESLDDLPAEWFRTGPLTPPPPRRMAADTGLQEAMVDAAPGDPTPPPRLIRPRRSSALVLIASLIPVGVIGGFVWQLTQRTDTIATPAIVATTSVSAPASTASRAPSRTPSASTKVLAPKVTVAPVSASKSSTTGVLTSWPQGVPTNATRCGVNVYAGSDTDCGFALDVAAKVPDSRADSVTVWANIPRTKRTYRMTCKRSTLTVCGGGIDLRVYIAR